MNRIFDLLVALGLMLIFAPLFLLMVLAVRLTSTGPVRFRTRRVGKNSRLFTMYKFRTMRMDAPQVAAHLLKEPDQFFANIQAGLPILARTTRVLISRISSTVKALAARTRELCRGIACRCGTIG